jgi:hypothetical protein
MRGVNDKYIWICCLFHGKQVKQCLQRVYYGFPLSDIMFPPWNYGKHCKLCSSCCMHISSKIIADWPILFEWINVDDH